MIEWPPGEPITIVSFPFSSNTRVGAIELRGRFFASTRLATGLPSSSGAQEKSVSSLLRKNPRTIWRLPNAASTLADLQELQHREAARAGRRHAAYFPAAVPAAQRLAPYRGIGGEVRLHEVAGCALVAARRSGDVARDPAAVERVSAARRDALQH